MAKEKLQWHTEKRKVNDLAEYEKNPRVISEQQIKSLKRSFKKFDLVEIPAVDTDGKIVAGHQRIKILQILNRGEEVIDVRVPNRKLTEDEYKDYLLTSNAVHGDWNYDILREFDADLLLQIGFSDDDISNIWDNNLEVDDDNFNEEKELAKIKEPIIYPGEIYQLGMHKLICADSQDIINIQKLVGKEKIDLIDVDPPYNIGLNYNSGIGTKNKYGGKMKDNKTDEDYNLFLKSLIKNSLTVSKENAHVFFWCDQKYIGLLQSLYKELNIDSKRVCLWIKNNQNPTPQIAFNKAYEPCVYGTIGKPFMSGNIKNLNEVLNKEVGTGGRLIDDIMDLFDIWLVKRLPTLEYEHPTQKPPTLHDKVLRRCTRPGDNVLDLCAGSGSLMVACEQLKRRSFLSEADPIFATLIIKRYEKLTNKKAKKLS